MPNSLNPPPERKVAWAAMAGLVAVPVIAVVLVALGLGSLGKKQRKPVVDESGEALATAPAAPEPGRPRRIERTLTPAQHGEPQTTPVAGGSDIAAAKIEESRRVDNTDPQLSRQLLREALQADPTNHTALQRLGTKMMIDENQDEARSLAQRCLNVAASDPTCDKINQFVTGTGPENEKIAKDAEGCAKQGAPNAICLYIMVDHNLATGNTSEAAIIAGRLTQIDPNSIFTQSASGRIKAASGNYSAARPLFEAGCKQNDPQACFRAEVLRGEGW